MKKYTNWKILNFEEVKQYYETHTREETLKHFNLSQTSFYSLLKYNNYKKPSELCYENYKKTIQEKYGVDNFFQTEEGIKISHSEESNKKRKISTIKTMQEKYGVDWYTYTEHLQTTNKQTESIEKRKISSAKTKLERYGDPNYNNIEKIKQTVKDKYNVENVFDLDEVKDKIKQTVNKKYEVENVFQAEEIKEKIKQTNIEKYGVEYYTQTTEYHRKAKKRYKYQNEYFDSAPELAMWIYCKDSKIEILKNPIKLPFEFNNKLHYYIPDFEINGKLIELKGDHFFKADGTMCNPFDHTQDALYEAKHQCGLTNNVEFYRRKDYDFAIKYCIITYGENWLELFTEGIVNDN